MNETKSNHEIAQEIADALLTTAAGVGDRLAVKKNSPNLNPVFLGEGRDSKEIDLGGRSRNSAVDCITYLLNQYIS